MSTSKTKISVVIPVYNEELIIPSLYKRLFAVLKKDFKSFSYEIIFVDDGSTDNSFAFLKTLHKSDKNVKVIQFSRNFGHHIAISAGLDEAKGNFIFLMDGDLQDPPEEMLKLYKKLREGYDIVYGIRSVKGHSIFKEKTSLLFWKIMGKISNLSIPANQAMLRVFNKNVLNATKQFKESQRFYAGIFSWVGFRQTTCLIKYDKRRLGKTKYSFSKMLALSTNAVLSFSNLPLYYISYLGIFISLFSFILGVIYIIRKVIFNLGVIGWPSLMILLSFLGGIIIFSIGVLGIYIGKIQYESLRRPLYIINNKLI